MHKQRIWTASIAAFGVLTLFLPWVNVNMLISIGVSGTEVDQGWLVAAIFVPAIALALTGPRAYALDNGRRGALCVLGVAGMGVGIWKLAEIMNGTVALGGEMGREMEKRGAESGGELGREMGRGFGKLFGEDLLSTGFGIYCVIAAGLALVIAAALQKRAA